MDHLTSMGISNEARDFLEAAQVLRTTKPPTFTPLYFLACQSIELSMKAYLRGSGDSEKQLKDIGHNLNKGLRAARDHGIATCVVLSEADARIIEMINPYYQGKDLQYSRSGFKSFPDIDALIALGERMWNELRTFCIEHREYHYGKPTEVA